MNFLEKLWVFWLGGSLAHAGISYDKTEFYVILVPTVVLVFLKDCKNEK